MIKCVRIKIFDEIEKKVRKNAKMHQGGTNVLKEKEMMLLSHFRSNARISLTKLSKLTKIPVSTIFDKLKDYETRQLIKKSTAIIDFRKLGFEIRNQILISAKKENKDELQRFLIRNKKVNTIYRINNGYDFLIETVFRNMNEMDEFMKSIDAFEPLQKKEFFIMEDLKREEFLSGQLEQTIKTQL